MKYINAAQSMIIAAGLCADKAKWEMFQRQLQQYGYLQGGGVDQELDGELVVLAIYREGTITTEDLTRVNLLTYQGFRIKAEARPIAVAGHHS